MNCPSCGAGLAQASPACPSCGLSLKALDDRFGFVPRHRATVTDLGQILSQPEVVKLEKQLKTFMGKFPGTAFAVILTKLPPVRKASEYCFWLINRGNFAQSDAKLGRNRTILLLLDAGGPGASLMVGYGLEHVLSESDLRNAVETTTPFLKGHDFFGAALACVQAVGPVLRKNIATLAGGSESKRSDGGEPVSGLEPASRVSL